MRRHLLWSLLILCSLVGLSGQLKKSRAATQVWCVPIEDAALWPNWPDANPVWPDIGTWEVTVGNRVPSNPWIVGGDLVDYRRAVELLHRYADTPGIWGFHYHVKEHTASLGTENMQITTLFYRDNVEIYNRIDQYITLSSANGYEVEGEFLFPEARTYEALYIDFAVPPDGGSFPPPFMLSITEWCMEAPLPASPTPTRTAPVVSATPYPTNTARPTATASVTRTPRPSATPLPSISPVPTNTLDPVLPTLTPTDTLTPGGPTETPLPPPTDLPTVTPLQSTPDDSIPGTPVPPDQACTDPSNPCDIFPPLELPNWDLESPTPILPHPTLTPLPSMTLRSVVTVEVGTGTPMFGEVAYLATYVSDTVNTLHVTPVLNNVEGTPYDLKQTMYEAGESIGSMVGIARSVVTADLGRVGNILLFLLALIALNLLIRLLFFVVPIVLRLVEFVIQVITFVVTVIKAIAGAILGFL